MRTTLDKQLATTMFAEEHQEVLSMGEVQFLEELPAMLSGPLTHQ